MPQRGAHLIEREFEHFDSLCAMYQRSSGESWADVNPDYSELDNKWTALHFVKEGQRTEVFSRYPEMEKVVAAFPCEIDFLMFYQTEPGTDIPPHRDLSGNLPLGRLRFHIPIVTNDNVDFYVEGERVTLREGELWALDTSYTHSVRNFTPHSRCHVVIEVKVNDWVRSLLPPQDLKYYLHTASFLASAGVTRVKNVALNPKLLRQTLRQSTQIAKTLLLGRPVRPEDAQKSNTPN